MKAYFVSLTLVLLISQFACAQQSSGSVCVASRADDPFWKEPIPPSGEINSHGLRVKIDKRPAMAWPRRKSLKIEAEYKSTDLCMSYDGYQGVQLHEDTRRTPWCKCK
jgi:hypothetical protein